MHIYIIKEVLLTLPVAADGDAFIRSISVETYDVVQFI